MPKPETDLFLRDASAEGEDDAKPHSHEQLRQAFVTGSDWTTETIVNQLRKGNIDLNPIFQRRQVWTKTRQSRLIESIILNLPIPQLVLAERQDEPGKFIVLDGKQRLLTIRQFCADTGLPDDHGFDSLTLRDLAIRADLVGESYESLKRDPAHTDIVNAFDNHTIRTVTIRNWPDHDYLHRVFLRLNTGSVPLSPQELRQALLPGPFTDYVDEFATKCGALRGALRLDKPDFRMRDNEIFLRYVAFVLRANDYAGNLKRFLDETTRTLNSCWTDYEDRVIAESRHCEESILAVQDVFGPDDAFSTFRDGSYEGRFNRAVFDIMTFFFRVPAIREAALGARNDVKTAFEEASTSHEEFHQSLTTTTKSKRAVATRFVVWAESLRHAADVTVEPPPAFANHLRM